MGSGEDGFSGTGFGMSHDDIDLDRVLIDPAYRREVIRFLNAAAEDDRREAKPEMALGGSGDPPPRS
jgi:hypothetical protein